MRVIDITGPEGNAFVLLGYATKWSKQLNLDGDKITKEMMSGNYEHLLDVFEENFSEVCELIRD